MIEPAKVYTISAKSSNLYLVENYNILIQNCKLLNQNQRLI